MSGGTYKSRYLLPQHMALCPHCESDLSHWARKLEQAPAASAPKVWTCPECDVVLGVSDWQ